MPRSDRFALVKFLISQKSTHELNHRRNMKMKKRMTMVTPYPVLVRKGEDIDSLVQRETSPQHPKYPIFGWMPMFSDSGPPSPISCACVHVFPESQQSSSRSRGSDKIISSILPIEVHDIILIVGSRCPIWHLSTSSPPNPSLQTKSARNPTIFNPLTCLKLMSH